MGSTGKNEKHFDRYRAAEIKHGRVAMLAATGLLAQHSWRLPEIIVGGGDGNPAVSLNGVPSGFTAITCSPAAPACGVLFLVAGFFELVFWTEDGRGPGDFGDPLEGKKWMENTYLDAA